MEPKRCAPNGCCWIGLDLLWQVIGHVLHVEAWVVEESDSLPPGVGSE